METHALMVIFVVDAWNCLEFLKVKELEMEGKEGRKEVRWG